MQKTLKIVFHKYVYLNVARLCLEFNQTKVKAVASSTFRDCQDETAVCLGVFVPLCFSPCSKGTHREPNPTVPYHSAAWQSPVQELSLTY